MFELDQAIIEWRRQLSSGGIKPAALLDELESHLRDDIAALISTGKSEERAFALAASRLGEPGFVASEFKKSHGHSSASERTVWLIWLIASAVLATILLNKCIEGKLGLLLATHIFSLTAGYGAAFLTGCFGICYVCCRWFGRLTPAREQKLSHAVQAFCRISTALVVVGLSLGIIWSTQNRGHILTGDPREIGGLLAVAWLLALCVILRAGRAGCRAKMLLSIAGNMVISLAWFGAGAAEHGYAIGSYWPLNALLVIHLLFLALGLLPVSEMAEA